MVLRRQKSANSTTDAAAALRSSIAQTVLSRFVLREVQQAGPVGRMRERLQVTHNSFEEFWRKGTQSKGGEERSAFQNDYVLRQLL